MVFSNYAINKISKESQSPSIIPLARKHESDFTRKGKIKVRDLILFNLNKRGLSLKMEIDGFIEETGLPAISSPGMLNRRMRLNPEVFKHLNFLQMKDFYTLFKQEVKLFNGHALLAIDGSDAEIPNTPAAREVFGETSNGSDNSVARMKVSTCVDVLNGFILDTEVETYKYSERELANRHLMAARPLLDGFPHIVTADRGYSSLSIFYHWNKEGTFFVIRLREGDFKAERAGIKADDEWLEIPNQYDRVRHHRLTDPDLYKHYQEGKTVSIRVIAFPLPSGETEFLATNLPTEGFSKNDVIGLYDLRWGIETNYHCLKESLRITNLSSSKKDIIKQEVFSQVIVFNLVQALAREEAAKINQKEYSHLMKINLNMAIGHTKKLLIHIMLEERPHQKQSLLEKLHQKIFKEKIPVRPGRKSRRKKSTSNKYPVTKRKAF